MMVQGAAVVWLPVSDLSRSLTFYRDQLGLEQLRDEGEWGELDANGLRIGLNARESAHPGAAGGAVIAFQPDGRLDETVTGLKSQGVEFAGDISEHPWGRVASFQDPDGNDLQLYEPPSS